MATSEDQLEADRVDLLRRRVINVVGHELRTPLTTLRGLTDRLEAASPEELADLAPAIRRLAARMDGLLDDLLIAAGVTTAEPVEPAETIDLDELVRSIWREHAGNDEAVTGRAGEITGHRATVRGVIERLADNACGHGSAPYEVHCDDGSVTFSSGAADLTPGDVANMFELFYRGEAAVMRRPGLGVGLPLARSLARHEGGDVTVEVDGGRLVATARFSR